MGQVVPFSLSENDKQVFQRDGFDYQVFHDLSVPPLIDNELSDEYKWGFALVAIWSGHLDQSDDVMWDISPRSLGNINSFPENFEDFDQFYSLVDGGDASQGYSINPATGKEYEEQLVPRGDYARVLAEFWADGPKSETPPGHWFVILNSVSDHPLMEKRWAGEGDILGNLEWDIKTYFAMGGTMHDAAVTAWGVKGWYDYIRPVSAIRAMADLGQSTDPLLPSYHKNGLPLVPNHIELVNAGDPLAGDNNEHIGKIKLYAWRGPAYIESPATDQAGAQWILAEHWWSYQRPSFVTPPFAGYVSGHSTFSRAAAELMTLVTGSEYFPGGMSEFKIKANDFLVFEQGPSVDMTLQWATYQDASDQCSLSRIWGGIHPPADDLPYRRMGMKIGPEAFNKVQSMFNGN
ncbi:vanadium-dependent haloperoxidase [Psychrosphaera algicola]|uniref:Vanadium-dependent haloperoxidase n=1 Tax=Psychrosphaera algicola TaxID=3023714 RepID=A0ABT5FF99_9GAMM|nr:vanadium-dependent haloperoxidase [Psychrosphaera sp. G1-22]MDC2889543.1 vanadium-dependent haloperoxidase [Psychrosphaera sp. G1-22]